MHQSFTRLFTRKESMTEFTPGAIQEHNSSWTIGLGHVGMYARNPAALAEFYRDVMDMQIVGGSDENHPLGPTAFLSSRPGEESHEVAIFSKPELVHRAFKVESIAALKRFYNRIVGRGIPIKFQLLHGISIAFYFHDPEGNLIEVYWRTGLEYPQPCVREINLAGTEEEILGQLKAMTGAAGIALQESLQLAAG